MSKYRKKPVVIEAVQWFKDRDHPRVCFISNHRDGPSICRGCGRPKDTHGWIDTFEGGHVVCPGDWIITGVQGEHYPCKPDIFDETYEMVEELSDDRRRLQ